MKRFEGKTVLVTGASRGIGRATSVAFGREGARVVLSSRKRESLDEAASLVREAGGQAVVIPAHMGRMQDIERLVRTVDDEVGNIDVLVNNAATNPLFGPLAITDERAWDKIMEVNLKGPFFLSLYVGRRMMEAGGGSVVNVASIAGVMSAMGLGVYGISKAALVQMTRQMAREWATGKVRVNAVAPGIVETDFARPLIDNEMIRDEALKNVASGRWGQPEEIARTVLFLASEDASFITGQVIVADGGGIC